MEKRADSFKLCLLELLSIIFLVSFCIQAQSYKSDTTKTDTSKSNTSQMKKDTLGYNNINTPGSNIYSLNNNVSNVNLKNFLMTDTTKSDTAYKKSDTLGYHENGINKLAINMQLGNNTYLLNSSMTDTTKSDTTWKKPDSLGYNNIKSPEDNYASAEITGSDYYFQYDDSTKDTSETDTTKSDTLGYNNQNDSYYAYNNKINSTTNLNIRKHFLINPIKDLIQKLKLNVYLMDAQTGRVQKILREYEAKTYHSNGNNEELYKAALNAQNEIADILTVRQKKEWENTKNDWWASVNQAWNLSYINKNKDNLE